MINLILLKIAENQPGPPTNVVALPSSSSSIILSWIAPQGNFEIIAYVVYCKWIGDHERRIIVVNATQHIIKELHGFTNYTLYVRAVTKTLLGRKSRSVVQRTLEGSKSFICLPFLPLNLTESLSLMEGVNCGVFVCFSYSKAMTCNLHFTPSISLTFFCLFRLC